MQIRLKSARFAGAVAGAVAVASMAIAPTAFAHTGEFARFNNCPSTNPAVVVCLTSVTSGGEFVLGTKKVPIVNPVTLQGGLGEVESPSFTAKFVAATSGDTLSKSPQPVPGGLSGLVNCKEISLSWLRSSCEAVFENGLTGVKSTLELAKPVSEIRVSPLNLLFEEGTALTLPVKVHLENPLLGSECYVGSSSSPIMLNLTTGTTAPPLPNKPIKGDTGTFEEKEAGAIFVFNGAHLVDNSFSAPGASGCGGWPAEYILDPIINASVGVPSAAGKNTAVLVNTIAEAPAASVNEH
jgi:hypothetical protein